MASVRYHPEINPRAYAVSALLKRLAWLLRRRSSDPAPCYSRSLETTAITDELTARAVLSPLLVEALALPAERVARNRRARRPARRTRTTLPKAA